jgi:NADH-dependent peroxiredoxin subunit F
VYDLIILGGGPAGLTATVYAIRKRLNVLLISPDLGGKTARHMYLPDNMDRFQVINGEDVVTRFKSQVEYLEFARKLERAAKVEQVDDRYAVRTEEGNVYEARAIIVATGSGAARLNVPGEEKYRLHGLAYSAISYAPLFIDRTAAVVGEGELGVRSALELAQIARSVYLIAPSVAGLDSPAGRKLQESPHVTILSGYHVKAIKGDESFARSIVVAKGAEEVELAVDVTFVELHLVPDSDCVRGLVQLNDRGQIVVNCRTETSCPGIFAAGDVTDTFAEQVLICVGEGAKAALAAYEYILAW